MKRKNEANYVFHVDSGLVLLFRKVILELQINENIHSLLSTSQIHKWNLGMIRKRTGNKAKAS